MPRRREVPERPVMADPKYDSKLVTKFINAVMRDGKKSTAESVLYGAFDIIEDRTKEAPLKVFEKAFPKIHLPVNVPLVIRCQIDHSFPGQDIFFLKKGVHQVMFQCPTGFIRPNVAL